MANLPKGKHVAVPEPLRQRLLALAREGSVETILTDCEKIRRFASLHGRNLRKIAGQRFGNERDIQLSFIAELMLVIAPRHPDRGGSTHDHASLSAALYAADALDAKAGDLGARVRAACAELAWAQSDTPPDIIERPFAPANWIAEADHCVPVVIVSPNPFSLYTIAVLELCRRLTIPVAALVIRRFSAARAAQEWRRDGPRLVRKVWRKLVLRADENPADVPFAASKLIGRLAPKERDARKLAASMGAPVIAVDELLQALPRLEGVDADIALFTGGGMVGQPLIDRFKGGMINVHMGLLPHYRGMDVVEAPVLEHRFDSVGLCAHKMVKALDAGPIVSQLRIPTEAFVSRAELRNYMSGFSAIMSVDAALGLSSGRLQPVAQPKGSGRHFHIVHPALIDRIDPILKQQFEGREAIAEQLQVIDALLERLPD